jgi:hypothetical protein
VQMGCADLDAAAVDARDIPLTVAFMTGDECGYPYPEPDVRAAYPARWSNGRCAPICMGTNGTICWSAVARWNAAPCQIEVCESWIDAGWLIILSGTSMCCITALVATALCLAKKWKTRRVVPGDPHAGSLSKGGATAPTSSSSGAARTAVLPNGLGVRWPKPGQISVASSKPSPAHVAASPREDARGWAPQAPILAGGQISFDGLNDMAVAEPANAAALDDDDESPAEAKAWREQQQQQQRRRQRQQEEQGQEAAQEPP